MSPKTLVAVVLGLGALLLVGALSWSLFSGRRMKSPLSVVESRPLAQSEVPPTGVAPTSGAMGTERTLAGPLPSSTRDADVGDVPSTPIAMEPTRLFRVPSVQDCLESNSLNPNRLVLDGAGVEQLRELIKEINEGLSSKEEERSEAIKLATEARFSSGASEALVDATSVSAEAGVVASTERVSFGSGRRTGVARSVTIRVGEEPGIDGMTSELQAGVHAGLVRIREYIRRAGNN